MKVQAFCDITGKELLKLRTAYYPDLQGPIIQEHPFFHL
jgi:hypothetical protein